MLALKTAIFLLTIAFLALLTANAGAALITITEAICSSPDNNQVWTTGNTYFINADGAVAIENCQLTIEPGVIVKLKRGGTAYLNVTNKGVIKAQGTSANKIHFTSMDDDSIGETATGSDGSITTNDYFSAIQFASTAGFLPDANDLFDLNISFASSPLFFNYVEKNFNSIHDCNFQNNAGGLTIYSPVAWFYNNTIKNTGTFNIDGTIRGMYDNFFIGNGGQIIDFEATAMTDFNNNYFSNGGTIEITGTTITNLYKNTFTNGGTAINIISGNITNFFDNNFSNNSGASISSQGTITNMYNNLFYKNTSAAISNSGTITNLYNNLFLQNSGTYAGAISNIGVYTTYCMRNAVITNLFNNTFFANSSENGGAIYLDTTYEVAGTSTCSRIINSKNNIFSYSTGTAVYCNAGCSYTGTNNAYWANDTTTSNAAETSQYMLSADPFINDNSDRNFLYNNSGISQLQNKGTSIGTDSWFNARTIRYDNRLDYGTRDIGYHYDQNSPHIAIVSPTTGAYKNNVLIDFNVSSTGQNSDVAIDLNIIKNSSQDQNVLYLSQAFASWACSGNLPTTSMDRNCTYVLDSTGYADANYLITARATDNNGTGIFALTNSFAIDNTTPTLSLTVTGITTTGLNASISYIGTASSGIKTYWISTDNGNTWINNGTNTDYNFSISSGVQSPFEQTILVKATNNADTNTGIQTATVKFESATGSHEYCGNEKCDSKETPATCPNDCAAICGDGICTGTETINYCPEDCAFICGDNYCSENEDCLNCSTDCGTCYNKPEIKGIILSQTTQQANTQITQIAQLLKSLGLEQIIGQAINASTDYEITRTITTSQNPDKSYTTTVTITVKSKTGAQFTGLTLLEIIPKSIAENATQIQTNNEIIILGENAVQFIATGKLGKEINFYYWVNKKISEENPFIYSPIILNHTIKINTTCAQACDDKNPCTKDQCINNQCANFLLAEETPCGYAQKCHKGICITYPTKEYKPPITILGQPAEIILLAIGTILIFAAIGLREHKKNRKKTSKQ